ncbi:hypothetical protein SAMN05192549_104347 [Duganella sacchari]|uniref:Zinc-ribbon domain-containing protein n=1 Tax=Duganella sacchari TaxID=551987 RepID=A0A1M7P2F6_9BURK|nr:zinc ribbon domain-containing protein [Duganella sacchari]SHN10719.1 hypothetical protein SAMN05192549_104347 [Duganella sacchari]
MSYEFNPENKLFEFPNPYKVQNLALLVAGGLLTIGGIGTLVSVRERIAQGTDLAALKVIGIAVVLMVLGFAFLGRAFVQLRFFFGRNRPASLAPVIAPDADGDSRRAAEHKETLRQNALTYAEPKGALNGLLYSLLPALIFAPREVRLSAQTQFYNFLALAATFLSFLVCWVAFGQSPAAGWIGLAYGLFAFVQIIRPMMRGRTEEAQLGVGSLVVLVVVAVLGPVILGMLAKGLPALGEVSINSVVCVALLCALVSCAVFGLALKKQLHPAPETVGAARVTETVTMNAHPNKLIEELDRILMTRWYSNIPNRRYTRHSPQVDGRQGQFTAELFEETQPRPQTSRVAEGLGHAFSSPRFFWLTCLTALGLIFTLAGLVAALLVSQHILHGEPVASTAAFALSQFAVAIYCLHAAQSLWGRFDFVSELIWVDINGSYESAQMNVGNQVTSQLHSSKSVINIEAMTVRVWVSEIDTVIFGKDGQRQMVGMRGLPLLADELAKMLKGFGETRSAIVAPTSQQDLQRAQSIGVLGKVVAGVVPPEAAGLSAVQPAEAIAALPACKQCGASMGRDARFCSDCGTAV